MTPAPQGPPPDSVRAVLRRVFEAPEYAWRLRRSPLDILADAWRSLMAWMDHLARDHPVGFLALMLVLTVVVVVMFTHLAFVLRRALRRAPPEAPAGAPALPAAHDAAWHVSQARRLAGEGRFTDALGHRFVALVLELERRRAVAVKASKTPAEYAREVRLDEEGRRGFAALVATLYAALFGGRSCDANGFADFDRQAAALVHRASIR